MVIEKKKINTAKIMMIAGRVINEALNATEDGKITVREILDIVINVLDEFGYDIDKIAIKL